MPSGFADDNNLPGNPHPVVCGDASPDDPPTRGEAAEGEAHTSSHSFKNNARATTTPAQIHVSSTVSFIHIQCKTI